MTTLRHPHVEDMTVDVPDDTAESWKAQGWKTDTKTGKTRDSQGG